MKGAALSIGRLATTVEIKARWAYSEIPSRRFGGNYLGQGSGHLRALALEGHPFSEVDRCEWPTLAAMAERARTKAFVDSIDVFGSPHFRCESWRVEDLLSVHTLPVFGSLLYSTFLTKKPRAVRGNEDVAFDQTDPRVAAWGVDPTQPFQQIEAVIIIRVQGQLMLLDGYLRSLLWFRRSNFSTPLLAWLPVDAAP
jgi:hypothetical protein